MSVPVVAFFNNKGGVGKTSLVYHLAWMYADLDRRVLAADFDPQASLTAAFLDEERLEELWGDDNTSGATIYDAVEPLLRGVGDIETPHCEEIADQLTLLAGSLALARFEDELSQQWPLCLDRKERAFRVVSAFWRMAQRAAEKVRAEVILVDLGPNLGAINRAALISTDYVVIPLAPDLFSLQGLKNLGPSLRTWRGEWQERLKHNPERDHLELPAGHIEPVGYVVWQHGIRLDRPVRAYDKWMARIPSTYAGKVLEDTTQDSVPVERDPHCLGMLRHYRSLIPMAQEARKPMFHLKPADGALGAHFRAVEKAREDFERLAKHIAERSWDARKSDP
ncbi:MAG: AAA family ATPase [Pseudomonadota bacterium]